MPKFKSGLIVFLVVLICLPSAFARKKKDKTGAIVENVYTDAEYDFKLTIRENWQGKVFSEPSNYRLEVEQTNPEIPPEYAEYASEMPLPAMSIYLATVDLTPVAFVDSLLSQTYKSDQKKEILKDVDFFDESISFQGFTTRIKKGVKFGDLDGVQWEGTARYNIKMGEQSISNETAVGLLGIKKGKNLLLFLTGHDKRYFRKLFDEAIEMAMSVKW
jgi:hypothetical protein